MPHPQDVKRALNRVRSAMPPGKRTELAHRKIRLGLERINRIVPRTQSWKGVHVAGTNGKGSICTLLAGMMRRCGISHGVFLSPAIPEPHNGILINGRYIHPHAYQDACRGVRESFERRSRSFLMVEGEEQEELTPFETETVAAFRLFENMHVKYGIVEVGMGGATDATNAMVQKSVTIISRIDLDHQEYLGHTLEKIAAVKAGIMRKGVPCVVDSTNEESVLQVLKTRAKKLGVRISLSESAEPFLPSCTRNQSSLQEYERHNFLCAVLAFKTLFPNLPLEPLKKMSGRASLPGRTESLAVSAFSQGLRTKPILADGAHNLLGVRALKKYLKYKMRVQKEPVTWVLGFSYSETKPFPEMIEALIRPQDNVAFVEFTTHSNDPSPTPAEFGLEVAEAIVKDKSQLYQGDPYISPALEWALQVAGEGPVVVTGSLYLVRDLLRLEGVVSNRKIGTRPAGVNQIWRYQQLAKTRDLTPEEECDFKRARRHWISSPMNPNSKAVLRRPMTSEMKFRQTNMAFHKRQVESYSAAIESMERDLAAGIKIEPPSTQEAVGERQQESDAGEMSEEKKQEKDVGEMDWNKQKTLEQTEKLDEKPVPDSRAGDGKTEASQEKQALGGQNEAEAKDDETSVQSFLCTRIEEVKKLRDQHAAAYEKEVAQVRRSAKTSNKTHAMSHEALFGCSEPFELPARSISRKYRLDFEPPMTKAPPLLPEHKLPQFKGYEAKPEKKPHPEDMGAIEAAWAFGEGRNKRQSERSKVPMVMKRHKDGSWHPKRNRHDELWKM
ncbi:hypothetical protein CDD81_4864 [Ophiocordyceps australis]|uniref:Mur ligase central domain-containing protein n=1 Tax=Ophiocordyceps australis TaxID=1399860 RepID=A0A2C5Y9W8_9HYPO|nr:hypothetical protein CDD81_4864 [Ophiocordyceps australis]